MTKLAVHIGLHKTGTTYLQEVLFPTIENLEVVRGYSQFRDFLKVDAEKIILSDESISGRILNGYTLEEFKTNLHRLKYYLGNPQVILGIRNQESLIPSLYKQYVHERGSRSIDFIYNVQDSGIIKHNDLLLKPRIDFVKEHFNEVFIYSQEMLRSREQDFLEAVTSFLGVENKVIPAAKKERVNVSISTKFQMNTLLSLNKLNRNMERIHPKISLYSRLFNKLKVTPRHLCQDYLRRKKSEKFILPSTLNEFIKDYYSEDWTVAKDSISF